MAYRDEENDSSEDEDEVENENKSSASENESGDENWAVKLFLSWDLYYLLPILRQYQKKYNFYLNFSSNIFTVFSHAERKSVKYLDIIFINNVIMVLVIDTWRKIWFHGKIFAVS